MAKQFIYRPFAILALGICVAINLALIAGFGYLTIDLVLRPANEARNIGMAVMALVCGYSVWMLVDFVQHFQEIIQDILHG